MKLADVGIIAADTARTRAYLMEMERHKILPGWALILDDIKADRKEKLSNEYPHSVEYQAGIWRNVDFDRDPKTPIHLWLKNLGVEFEYSDAKDINSSKVVKQVGECDPSVLIYSGYGGKLLGEPLLSTGKRFLHVHGGYLPNYKGSTTNYYSLLHENKLGASSLFLNSELDGGSIILRRKFSPPVDKEEIDHTYDCAVRASVLVETLKAYVNDSWDSLLKDNDGGDLFYIIHPILKHMAILAPDE